ncbi:hypothetical protein LCGC14_2631850 [marine sediment metagenome]|uniref:Uncharacterized protein n=1 Tax=marine sediment metagenome TaxID=412755 RepID=A0A0F9A085_9ZZZZ
MSEDSPIPITGEIIPAPIREVKVRTKRIRHKQAIEKAEMMAARNLPKYFKLLEALSRGVLVVEIVKGKEEVYRTPPDRQALQYLMDRGMGKAVSKTEITGEDGAPIVVTPYIPRSGCCRDDG